MNKSREDYDPYFFDPEEEILALERKREYAEAYWEHRMEMQAENEYLKSIED